MSAAAFGGFDERPGLRRVFVIQGTFALGDEVPQVFGLDQTPATDPHDRQVAAVDRAVHTELRDAEQARHLYDR
jgi:hypothetical protein